MKKIISFILLISMVLSITACGQVEKKPEDTVKAFCDAIVKYDFDKANSLTVDNNFANDIDAETDSEANDEFTKVLLSKAEYNIISTEQKEETAVAKVSISNVDMSVVMGEYIAFVFANAFSESAEEIDQNTKLIELMNSVESKFTKELDIELKKVNDEWKVVIIEDDTSIANAFTGGYVDYANDLNDSFNSTDE